MQPYVIQLDTQRAAKLHQLLRDEDYEISQPAHTLFSAKKPGISCTYYKSGKLVVQGKGLEDFVKFTLEPHVLENFSMGYEELELDTTPRCGVDESGKGDIFGPLCVAGVFADAEQIRELHKMGICDSKKISDTKIARFAQQIRKLVTWHVVRINPPRYNDLYAKFRNLNRLLGWGHATVIEHLVRKSNCRNVLIDQFASESVVLDALGRKNIAVDLRQRHRAEEDVVVAAASILARDDFVQQLKKLGERFGLELPKGAGPKVPKQLRAFVQQHGVELLAEVSKMHFKTVKEVLPS